jgi:hypothetical protein
MLVLSHTVEDETRDRGQPNAALRLSTAALLCSLGTVPCVELTIGV